MPTADAADLPRRPIDGLRRWASTDPHRTALSDGVSAMTFGELLAYVETCAPVARSALRAVPADAFLPVLVDRSVGSAAAVLACLLGRVPFFPVDAAAAPELIASLVRRAGAPGVHLAGPRDAPDLPGSVALVPDATAGDEDEDDDEPDAREPGLVIFSSGTTGEPKGIVLTWAALEARWRSRDAEYAATFDHERRQPLVIPLDSSWGIAKVADVASGFAEHIVDVTRLRPAEFLGGMAAFGATAMAIPSQFARILAQLRVAVPVPTVRRLHIAAEGFRYEYLDGLRTIFGARTQVVHSLASSEGGREIATTFALGDAPASGAVHLGEPLFPDDLRVVPVPDMDGVGEVHVGGSIAMGYLDDPELTAQRFYADDDGRRWWRSRDLVSYDPGSGYRHVGRLDDVVKVQGKLASPADVTAVLVRIDGVASAVTVPVATSGSTRLVAHVELVDGSALSRADVHAALAARLPRHAVPAAVMRHARLPVTGRGKVDRAALMAGPFERW